MRYSNLEWEVKTEIFQTNKVLLGIRADGLEAENKKHLEPTRKKVHLRNKDKLMLWI
jgi:hypothetical protein